MGRNNDSDDFLENYLKEVRENYKPLFVYGTLMTGFGNHATFGREVINVKEGTISGFNMYPVNEKYSFPYITRGDGIIYGELIYVDKEYYPYILNNVDYLEGYNEFYPEHSMYTREEVTCIAEDGENILAWCYIWNGRTNTRQVVSGDWRKAKQEIIIEKLKEMDVN